MEKANSEAFTENGDEEFPQPKFPVNKKCQDGGGLGVGVGLGVGLGVGVGVDVGGGDGVGVEGITYAISLV